MGPKVHIAGALVDKADATISVYDHGLLYGDGVFEGIRAYHGEAFRLQDHLQRLYSSARAIRLDIPITAEEMADAIHNTLQANGLHHSYIRVCVTRGAGALGVDPRQASDPQVIIINDHVALYPKGSYEKGLEVIIAKTRRNHAQALDPRIKSMNYLNNILAKIECFDVGCSEAVMLNHKGEVAECTGDNIFIVRDGVVLTPPADAGILEGVTRHVVLELAAQANVPARETTLRPDDLYAADECFLTGTAAEVIPGGKVDGRPLGLGRPGPITQNLMKRFHDLTRKDEEGASGPDVLLEA
jgi:branched-chain amino acid aminotransferase